MSLWPQETLEIARWLHLIPKDHNDKKLYPQGQIFYQRSCNIKLTVASDGFEPLENLRQSLREDDQHCCVAVGGRTSSRSRHVSLYMQEEIEHKQSWPSWFLIAADVRYLKLFHMKISGSPQQVSNHRQLVSKTPLSNRTLEVCKKKRAHNYTETTLEVEWRGVPSNTTEHGVSLKYISGYERAASRLASMSTEKWADEKDEPK